MKKLKQIPNLLTIAIIFIILTTSCGGGENKTTISYSSSKDDKSSSVSSTNNEEWDKMLDDYEEYVDKYVILYKKAMTGDATAIAEYPGLLEKATELSESLQKAQDNNSLTSKHLVRMAKIQKKMLEAVSTQ